MPHRSAYPEPETRSPAWPRLRQLDVRTDVWRLAVIGLIIVLIWRLADVMLLLFFAVLIATMLRGLADKLAAWLHVPQRLMLAVVVIVLSVGGCATVYWIGPAIAGQADDLVSRLTQALQYLRNTYGNTSVGMAMTARLFGHNGIESDMTGYAFDVVSFTVGTTGELFAVLVLSVYLAASPEMYVNGLVSLVPRQHRHLARRVIAKTGEDLRRWLLGQLIDMIVVGGLSAVGLYFLGVPVPFALATLAGILTIVPYIGALTAGLAAVVVALTQGWIIALWAAAIFTVCHIVESYILAPALQHHLVRMPPALALGAMTVAATLFGIFGVVLGTPLTVAALVIVRGVYIEHILGDHNEADTP